MQNQTKKKMTAGILYESGEGTSYWVLGDLYTFKVTGEETGGMLTIIDQVIQPQSGPPPHVHYREDEAFYILHGEFEFICGEERKILQTGSFVFVPKGMVHTFKNIGKENGRLLVTITPAGLEKFFYEIGSKATNLSVPPPFATGVIDRLMSIAKDYHMEIKLPPK